MKTSIIIHCSATPPSMDIGRETIKHWHVVENGWDDIGYNAIIRRDGTLEKGRDLDNDGDWVEENGAHARGFNTNSIGICLIGGINDKGRPDANFTFAQYTTLYQTVRDLQARFGNLEVMGHRDISKKECPSFNAKEFFKSTI